MPMQLLSTIIKSSLFKAAGIYGVLNVIRQLIPFLLLPVITHYLTPTDYGTLAMFNVVISFVYIFVSLNLDGAIGREYFDREKINFPNYVANCLGTGTVCLILFIPIIYVFGPMSESVTGIPHELLWVVLVVAYCRYIMQVLLVIWQSSMRAVSYSAMQIAQIVAEVSFTVFFVVVLKMGLQGRVDAVLITGVTFAVVAFVFLLKGGWLKAGFNPAYLRMAFSFGIPLIPHVLGGIAISMTDRALLMNMVGPEQTGLYFIGFQIGNAINMAVWAFNQAWNPWLFEQLKKDDEAIKLKIVKFSYLYCLGIIFMALAVWAVSPILFKYFIGPNFAGGLEVVVWIALGSAFLGMYYTVGCYITYTRKTHILSWITFLVGIINLFVSYFLIKSNGYVGAAQGTMIAYFISFVLTWALAIKVYPMPWLFGLTKR